MAHSRIAVRGEHVRRAVVGSLVDDDGLQLHCLLCQDGRQGELKKLAAVARGDHHADQRADHRLNHGVARRSASLGWAEMTRGAVPWPQRMTYSCATGSCGLHTALT